MIARSDQARDDKIPWTAEPFLPDRISLTTLRSAVQGCRGCDLYKNATQAVFGEGPRKASIMFVGEQPGDQEDRQGRPFVGPAGRMLDKALQEVSVPRDEVYVTNAVKHFKFEQRGKRRLHGKPSAKQVNACKPWLEAELQLFKPKMLIALGATAAQSLFGLAFRVTKMRGVPFESTHAAWCMATVHPSSLLRAPDEASRRQAWLDFVADCAVIAKHYRRQVAAAAR